MKKLRFYILVMAALCTGLGDVQSAVPVSNLPLKELGNTVSMKAKLKTVYNYGYGQNAISDYLVLNEFVYLTLRLNLLNDNKSLAMGGETVYQNPIEWFFFYTDGATVGADFQSNPSMNTTRTYSKAWKAELPDYESFDFFGDDSTMAVRDIIVEIVDDNVYVPSDGEFRPVLPNLSVFTLSQNTVIEFDLFNPRDPDQYATLQCVIKELVVH